MAAAKNTKFVNQLKRTNSKIQADRAQRIGKSVSNAQTRLVMDLEEKVNKKQDELDAMMDLSTDNVSTSLNVISPDFNAKEFVEKINSIQVELNLLNIKLSIAQKTQAEWFDGASEE